MLNCPHVNQLINAERTHIAFALFSVKIRAGSVQRRHDILALPGHVEREGVVDQKKDEA